MMPNVVRRGRYAAEMPITATTTKTRKVRNNCAVICLLQPKWPEDCLARGACDANGGFSSGRRVTGTCDRAYKLRRKSIIAALTSDARSCWVQCPQPASVIAGRSFGTSADCLAMAEEKAAA